MLFGSWKPLLADGNETESNSGWSLDGTGIAKPGSGAFSMFQCWAKLFSN